MARRLAAMKTPRIALLAGLLLAATLGACAGTAAPSPTPTSSPTAEPSPTAAPPTQVPGGVGSGPSTGVVGGGGANPGDGGAKPVVPKPGTRDPHPVSVQSMQVQVEGRRAVVIAMWTSGVAPCYQLDTAAFKRDGNEITIALTEGHGGGDVACIEIAEEHSTEIDLGELEPGQYTVVAQDSVAQPVSFTIA